MLIAAKFSWACMGLAAMLVSSPATAARITDFDLNKLDNWSDAIAVCDVGRFLLTEPDLNADVISIAGHDNTRVMLYRPLYTPPNNFFSEAMRETFERVHKAGLVTPDSYGKSRLHYAQAMINAYRGATLADKRWLMDQMDLCYHLAARAGVKLSGDGKK